MKVEIEVVPTRMSTSQQILTSLESFKFLRHDFFLALVGTLAVPFPAMGLRGFAERLRAARAAAGMSRAQVSSIVGKPVSAIGAWERGDAEPDVLVLARLVFVYRVSADWLLTGRARLEHRFEVPERCRHLVPIAERCQACEQEQETGPVLRSVSQS